MAESKVQIEVTVIDICTIAGVYFRVRVARHKRTLIRRAQCKMASWTEADPTAIPRDPSRSLPLRKPGIGLPGCLWRRLRSLGARAKHRMVDEEKWSSREG